MYALPSLAIPIEVSNTESLFLGYMWLTVAPNPQVIARPVNTTWLLLPLIDNPWADDVVTVIIPVVLV